MQILPCLRSTYWDTKYDGWYSSEPYFNSECYLIIFVGLLIKSDVITFTKMFPVKKFQPFFTTDNWLQEFALIPSGERKTLLMPSGIFDCNAYLLS